jgi:cobalt-zinc-cadmium efflux system outer membrane protein
MRVFPFVVLVASGVVGGLTGCASVPRDAGFSDVQSAVESRTGGRSVRWRRDSGEDRAAADALAMLLQRPLDGDAAVQIALLNNHNLQAMYEDLGVAQADVVQAGLLKNPVFDAAVMFPDRGPFNPKWELSVSQNFIELLLLPARKKLAAAQFDATKLRVTNDVLAFVAEVRRAYYTAIATQQTLALQRQSFDAAQAAAEAANRLQQAGNISPLDAEKDQAAFAEAQIELSRAELEARDAQQRLAELMGIADGAGAFTLPQQLAEIPSESPKAETLESQAIADRLDIATARKQIVAATRNAEFVRAARLMPEADLGARAERETDKQWVVGPSLTLPIPLFDQGQASTAKALAEYRRARQKYQALTVQAQSEVRLALAKMLAAQSRGVTVRDALLPARRQIVEQSQLHYNAMLLGLFDLLRAKQDEFAAERQAIEARRDYWIARADLERALGGPVREFTASTAPATQPSAPSTATAPASMESHEHHHH